MSRSDLKSAWEIVLEKLESQGEGKIEELNEETKEAIAETRQKYKARIAEAEINTAGRLKEAMESNQLDQIQTLQEELVAERKNLEARMETAVERIRTGEKPR